MEEPSWGTRVELTGEPWESLDGPSLVAAASGLQLLPQNIHCLARLQRLAAIGASLPPRPDAPLLTPSRLKSVLKNDFVGGQLVKSQEDEYEGEYVVEVIFDGGPRTAIQGLTAGSAYAVQSLLQTVAALAHEGKLPQDFVDLVYSLAKTILGFSHSLCLEAGLERGTFAPSSRGEAIFVPGQAKLERLINCVTFSRELPNRILNPDDWDALAPLTVNQGHHTLTLGHGTDDGLILTPFIASSESIIVAQPGELLCALRHRILTLAHEQGCFVELAVGFRELVLRQTSELLALIGATPERSHELVSDGKLAKQVFFAESNTVIELIVATDDLSEYDPTEPYGLQPSLVEEVNAQLRASDQSNPRKLQLVVYAGVGRATTLGLEKSDGATPVLLVSIDDLKVMVELHSDDPLFLWRFAQAEAAFAEQTRFMSWSTLDTYFIYHKNESSFYLTDEKRPDFVGIENGSGGELRQLASKRYDWHYVIAPDRPYYVEVHALHGADVAPIYSVHPRHRSSAQLVEMEGICIWVDSSVLEPSSFIDDMRTIVAYWIWQLLKFDSTLFTSVFETETISIDIALDSPTAWASVLAGNSTALTEHSQGANWISVTRPAADEIAITLHAAGIGAFANPLNEADRELVARLLEILRPTAVDRITNAVAPIGAKTMFRIEHENDVLRRPSKLRPRYVQKSVLSNILDDLGVSLRESGSKIGEIPSESRTQVLNTAVDYYLEKLAELVSSLDPDGLVEFLIEHDESLLNSEAMQEALLPSRIACFGLESSLPQQLLTDQKESVQAAIASRFLIEYVAATPPQGDLRIDLATYDDLMALSAEIHSRGLLSDAIHNNLSTAELAILESGRLGTSRDDGFTAGINQIAVINAEATYAIAGQTQSLEALSEDARQGSSEEQMREIDSAMIAEFGISLTDIAIGLAELINIADERSTDVARMPLKKLESELKERTSWQTQKVEAFIEELTLRTRESFMSIGPDAYPWRFSRNQSYLRRPLIFLNDDGKGEIIWGIRRAVSSALYWHQLIHTARIESNTPQMSRLMGKIRSNENRLFESKVEAALTSAGCERTARGVKKILGKRLITPAGADLGDIDALGIDLTHRTIWITEAKDFELARTPAELSNETKELLVGEKSAVFKVKRRAHWIQANLELVLRNYEIDQPASGWNVQPLVVTSRRLVSPHVLGAEIPVLYIGDLQEWIARQPVRGRSGGKRNTPHKRSRKKRNRS